MKLRNIYGYATETLLTITFSLQLRFGPTPCLRTPFAVLYAMAQAEFPNSFSIKKSNFPPLLMQGQNGLFTKRYFPYFLDIFFLFRYFGLGYYNNLLVRYGVL